MKVFRGEKPAINFIIKYIIPLVLADSDEDLEKAYFSIEEKSCMVCKTDVNRMSTVIPTQKSVLMVNFYDSNSKNPEYIENLNKIKEVRSFVKLSLYLALNKEMEIAKSNNFKYECSDGTTIIVNSNNIDKHLDEMKEILNDNGEPILAWNCPGKCYYKKNKRFYNSFELVKRTCVFGIIQSLYSELSNEKYLNYLKALETKVNELIEKGNNEQEFDKLFQEMKELEEAHMNYTQNNLYSEKLYDFVDWGKGHSKLGICHNCQKLFVKKRKSKIYCNDNCRVISNNKKSRFKQEDRQELKEKVKKS